MKIEDLNEKLQDLNRELAIANFKVAGARPAKPWSYAVFAIMFVAALLIFKPTIMGMVTQSNDILFETGTIPENALVILTANGADYTMAVKDILYYYPTEFGNYKNESMKIYKAMLAIKPAQFGLPAGDYNVIAKLNYNGEIIETVSKDVSIGESEKTAGQARKEYEETVKQSLIEQEKKQEQAIQLSQEKIFDPELEKQRIKEKLNNLNARVDRVEKINEKYDIDISENGLELVKLRGVRDTAQLTDVQKHDLSGKKIDIDGTDALIRTDALYVNPITIDSAEVTLSKSGDVNTILYCAEEDWSTLFDSCGNWQATTIPFQDLGDRITFTVNHFTTYAGGWINQSVSVSSTSGTYAYTTFDNGIIRLSNLTGWNMTITSADTAMLYDIAIDNESAYLVGGEYGTGSDLHMKIQKRNLTNGGLQWEQIYDPSASHDEINGVDVDNTGVYLGGKTYEFGNNGWIAEKRNLSSGNMIWRVTHNPSSSHEEIEDVAVSSEAVYLAGYDRIPGNTQLRLEKRNLSTGEHMWNITYNPTTDYEYYYAVEADEDAVYTGGNLGTGTGYTDAFIEKRNKTDGSLIWNYTKSYSAYDYVNSIYADTDYLYYAGQASSVGGVYLALAGKLNKTSGGLIWNYSYNYATAYFNSVGADSNTVYAYGVYGTNMWLSRFNNSNGAVLTTTSIDATSESDDGRGMEISGQNIYLAGFVRSQSRWYFEKRNKNTLGYSMAELQPSGNYTQVLDAGQSVIWERIYYENNTPEGTNITYQAATSDDNVTWTSYTGPDMTTTTYYNESGQSLNASTSQYLKYIFYLSTDNTSITPTVSNITVLYNYPTQPNGTESTTTTQLIVWDSSDNGIYGSEVTFYANYTNFTSGQSINGTDINCSFTENSSGTWSAEADMPFNTASMLYEYTKSLNGPASFQVNCNGTQAGGYAVLNTTPDVVVGSMQVCDEGDLNTECNITTARTINVNNYQLKANHLNILSGGSLNTTPGTYPIIINLTGNLTVFAGGKIETTAGTSQYAGNITMTADILNVSGQINSIGGGCTGNGCTVGRSGDLSVQANNVYITGILDTSGANLTAGSVNYGYASSAGRITINSTMFRLFLSGIISLNGGNLKISGAWWFWGGAGNTLNITSDQMVLEGKIYSYGGSISNNQSVQTSGFVAGNGGTILLKSNNDLNISNSIDVTGGSTLDWFNGGSAQYAGNAGSIKAYGNALNINGSLFSLGGNSLVNKTISSHSYYYAGNGNIIYLNGTTIAFHSAAVLNASGGQARNIYPGYYCATPCIGGNGGSITIVLTTNITTSPNLRLLPNAGISDVTSGTIGTTSITSPRFNTSGQFSANNLSIDSFGNLIVGNGSYTLNGGAGSRIQTGGNITIDTYGSLAVGNVSYGDSITILGNLTTDSPGMIFTGYNGGSVIAGYNTTMNLGSNNLLVPAGQRITVTNLYARNITALGDIILTGSEINAESIWINDTVSAGNLNITGLINITNTGTLSSYNITSQDIVNNGTINLYTKLDNAEDIENYKYINILATSARINSTNLNIYSGAIINSTPGTYSFTINATGNITIASGGKIETIAGAGQTAGNITITADTINISGSIESHSGGCDGESCATGRSGSLFLQSNSVFVAGSISTSGINKSFTTYGSASPAGEVKINATLFNLLSSGQVILEGGNTFRTGGSGYAGNGSVLNLTSENAIIDGTISVKGGNANSSATGCVGTAVETGGSAGNIYITAANGVNITKQITASGGFVAYCDVKLYGGSGGAISIISSDISINSTISVSGGYVKHQYTNAPSYTKSAGVGGTINITSSSSINLFENNLFNTSGGNSFPVTSSCNSNCIGGNGGRIVINTTGFTVNTLKVFSLFGIGNSGSNGSYGNLILTSTSFNASGQFSAYNVSIDNTGSLIIPNGGYISTDYASALIRLQSGENITINPGGKIEATSSGNIVLLANYLNLPSDALIRSTSSASINITSLQSNFNPAGNITTSSGSIYLYLPNFINTSESIYSNGAVINQAPWLYPDSLNCTLNNGDNVFRIKCNLNGTKNLGDVRIMNGSYVYTTGPTIINANNTIINNSYVYGQNNVTINSQNLSIINSGYLYFNVNNTYNLLLNQTNNLFIDSTSRISSTVVTGQTGGNVLIVAGQDVNITGNITMTGGSYAGATMGGSGSVTMNSGREVELSGGISLIGTSISGSNGRGGYGGNLTVNTSRFNFLTSGRINLTGGSADPSGSTGGTYGGSAGTLSVRANNVSLASSITASGGSANANTNGAYGGSGGIVEIISDSTSISSSITLEGGYSYYSNSFSGVNYYGGNGGSLILNTTSLALSGASVSLDGGDSTGNVVPAAPSPSGNGGVVRMILSDFSTDSSFFSAVYGYGTRSNGNMGIINITKDACSIPGGLFNPLPSVNYTEPCTLGIDVNINQSKFFAGQTGRLWGSAVFGDGMNASNYTARIYIDGSNKLNASTNAYGVYNTTYTFDSTTTIGENSLLANISTYTITNWSSSGLAEFWKNTKTLFNTPFAMIYNSFGRYNISAALFRLDINNQTIISNFTGGNASSVIVS